MSNDELACLPKAEVQAFLNMYFEQAVQEELAALKKQYDISMVQKRLKLPYKKDIRGWSGKV